MNLPPVEVLEFCRRIADLTENLFAERSEFHIMATMCRCLRYQNQWALAHELSNAVWLRITLHYNHHHEKHRELGRFGNPLVPLKNQGPGL